MRKWSTEMEVVNGSSAMHRRNERMSNNAHKSWQTRYSNEIKILEDNIKELRDDLYKDFMVFIEKTQRYHRLTDEVRAMHKKLYRLQSKGKGGRW